MLDDSGTTSDMTPFSSKVRSSRSCDGLVTLADDSSSDATIKDTRAVKWFRAEKYRKVHLSETIVVLNTALGRLSVPATTKKNILAIYMQGRVVLVDLASIFSVLRTAVQYNVRLYYIRDSESASFPRMSKAEKKNTAAMMAIVRNKTETSVVMSASESESTDFNQVDDPLSSTANDSLQHTDSIDDIVAPVFTPATDK